MKDRITDKWIEQQLNSYQPAGFDMCAMEQCLDRLPDIKKKSSIMPILIQQISYIPKYLYLLLISIYGALICVTVTVQPERLGKILFYFSLALIMIISLLIMFYMTSARQEIREIELSCKFGYSQVFLARIFWLVLIAIGYDFAMYVLLSCKFGNGFNGLNAMILVPVLVGACMALVVANRFGYRRQEGILITFIATSVLSLYVFQILLKNVFDARWMGILACIVLVVILALQSKNMLRGSVWYEAYSI